MWREPLADRDRGKEVSIHILCITKRLLVTEWIVTENVETQQLSKIFTERKIDIRNINCRTNKQEKATISVSFNVSCKDELNSLIEKIRQLESVLDVERTTG